MASTLTIRYREGSANLSWPFVSCCWPFPFLVFHFSISLVLILEQTCSSNCPLSPCKYIQPRMETAAAIPFQPHTHTYKKSTSVPQRRTRPRAWRLWKGGVRAWRLAQKILSCLKTHSIYHFLSVQSGRFLTWWEDLSQLWVQPIALQDPVPKSDSWLYS